MCSLMSAGEPTGPVLSASDAPVLLGGSGFIALSWLYLDRPGMGRFSYPRCKARASPPRREGLGDLLVVVERHQERAQGLGLVDVEQGVVAPRQVRRDVVAEVFVFGVVNHPDGA